MVLSWVRRGLRTGVLTTRYPAVREHLPDGFRAKPVIDANRCRADQGCTACMQICLPDALSLVDVDAVNGDERGSPNGEVRQLTLDYARCIMCGLCVTACPADALRMTEDYELAVSERKDLRVVTLFAPSIEEKSEHGKEREHGEPLR